MTTSTENSSLKLEEIPEQGGTTGSKARGVYGRTCGSISSGRVLDPWNKLSGEEVNAGNIGKLKTLHVERS